ncbi:MAG: hypothetical protein M3409_04745, partial [Gemmatimonadota bacterium]|nr:hypothetical protein [Gemmatimonadota bacterium]
MALPADTFAAREPADTTVADSLLPAAMLPEAPAPRAAGWGVGVWVWDREALLRFHGLSLLELLERVPALVITRAGGPGSPTGVAAWGVGGGRLRVFLDSWELDPLRTVDFDLQRLALADLEAVRVERWLGETRIHLFSFRLDAREARSRFEGGTGDLNTRLLRALFASPVGAANTVLVAGDIVDTDGARRQPFTSGTVIARWTRQVADGTALELEYRQNGFDRGGTFSTAATRRDLLLRGRSQLTRSLQLDAQLGRSSEDPRGVDTLLIARSAVQGGARALLD